MNRTLNRRLLLGSALGGALIAAAGPTRPLFARPRTQPIEGVYTGAFTPAGAVDPEADATLTIDPPRHRRLDASLTLTPRDGSPAYTVALRGTISASGNVSLLGRLGEERRAPRLILKGRFTDATPGTDTEPPAPKQIEGRYKVTGSNEGWKGTFTVAVQEAPPGG